ncbi:hypothetical protein BUE80_DR010921 [Diplocarpon rosae]|nr:hypothetical protein BUE80_DR010921 [Diplocarpon rosae]
MLSNFNLLALSFLSAAAFAAPKSDPTAKAPAQPTATTQARPDIHPYEWRITGDNLPIINGEMSDFKIEAPGDGLLPSFNADCPVYSRTSKPTGTLTSCWVENPEFSPEVKAALFQRGDTSVLAFEVSFQKLDLKASPSSLKYTGSATLTSGKAEENFVVVPHPSQ